MLSCVIIGLSWKSIVISIGLSSDGEDVLIIEGIILKESISFGYLQISSKLIPLLQQENTNLQAINETWVRTDSLKTVQLYNQKQMITQQAQDIERLNKSLKTSLTVGSTAVGISIVVTVLCLLLK